MFITLSKFTPSFIMHFHIQIKEEAVAITYSSIIKTLGKLVLNSQMKRHNEILNLDPFIYINYDNSEPLTFINAADLPSHENNSTIFNGEYFQQFEYNEWEITTAYFAGELKILVLLEMVTPFPS